MSVRLVTRGDLDGLVSAVILAASEGVDEVLLAHPQDVVQGRIEGSGDDVVVNLPYLAGCGRWFDHRRITAADPRPGDPVAGRHDPSAPSAASLVWREHGRDPKFQDLVRAVDRLDGGRLSLEDVLHPEGLVLLGYTLDGRSGLGSFHYYFLRCMDWVAHMDVESVLRQPLVENRVERLRDQREECLETLRQCSRQVGPVVVTDLRDHLYPPVGNRFEIYPLFPEAEVSLRVQWGPGREFVAATAGRSILRRTNRADLAEIMSRYGGGGHARAAGAPLPLADADRCLEEIVEAVSRD